jgi:hypothetical protein
MEYSIYFLSAGGTPATNVVVCDVLPPDTIFAATAYNGLTPTDGGVAGADQGLCLALSATSLPTAPTFYLTNGADADRGEFFPPGTQAPAAANAASGFTTPLPGSQNISGVVCVTVVRAPTSLPNATGPGTPTNSYGFVRFKVRVK